MRKALMITSCAADERCQQKRFAGGSGIDAEAGDDRHVERQNDVQRHHEKGQDEEGRHEQVISDTLVRQGRSHGAAFPFVRSANKSARPRARNETHAIALKETAATRQDTTASTNVW